MKGFVLLLYMVVSFVGCNLLFNFAIKNGYNDIIGLLVLVPFLLGEFYCVLINKFKNNDND